MYHYMELSVVEKTNEKSEDSAGYCHAFSFSVRCPSLSQGKGNLMSVKSVFLNLEAVVVFSEDITFLLFSKPDAYI